MEKGPDKSLFLLNNHEDMDISLNSNSTFKEERRINLSDKRSRKYIEDKENKKENINDKTDFLIRKFKEYEATSEAYDKWLQNYFDNPLEFFTDKNLKKLKKMDSGERLNLFALASSYLTVTPELAHRYYSVFPEDLQVVAKIFEINEGRPRTGYENFLFSISAEDIDRIKPDLKERFHFHFRRYMEITERKKYASKILLNNFEYKFDQAFKEFGKGAEGFLKALDEAADLIAKGDRFINPNIIFTKDYYSMPENKKASFLRKAIAELQYHLAYEEVYNSFFTQEMVDIDEQQIKQKAYRRLKVSYNPKHSMIYKTYQPVSVYEHNQDHFQELMNSTYKKAGMVEEYPYHRLLLAVLEAIKNIKEEQRENVELLVDFWDKNRNPIFGEAVANALSSQEVNLAATKLMELIHNKPEKDKNALASVLYRLEFGQVGISEEGVKYLEKIYDLGEYNNPDYHVSRLTADGQLGVFNEEKELIKYFHLGDLSSPEKKIRAKIMDFVYDTLFVGKKNETAEEKQRRLKYLEEFKQNYYQIANNEVFSKTGVRLNNLSFKEQGWFVIYFNHASQTEKNKLKNFVGQYGEEGIKTFLALEGGMQNSQAILNVGEKINPQVAEYIFRKFNSLASLFKEINQSLAQQFFKPEHYQQLDFTSEILARAQRILLAYEQKINQLKYHQLDRQQQTKVDNELLKSLDEIEKDAFLFTAMFKEYYRQVGRVDFQEFKGVDYTHLRADQLSPDDIQEMKKIYAENYQTYPEEFKQKLLEAFDQSLKNKQTFYDVLRYQGKVAAFLRFDYLGEENGQFKKHFAAFNVNKNFTQAKLGEAMLKQALEREKLDSVIIAECDPQAPITRKYFELGFKKVKEFTLAGVPSLQIELRG